MSSDPSINDPSRFAVPFPRSEAEERPEEHSGELEIADSSSDEESDSSSSDEDPEPQTSRQRFKRRMQKPQKASLLAISEVDSVREIDSVLIPASRQTTLSVREMMPVPLTVIRAQAPESSPPKSSPKRTAKKDFFSSSTCRKCAAW